MTDYITTNKGHKIPVDEFYAMTKRQQWELFPTKARDDTKEKIKKIVKKAWTNNTARRLAQSRSVKNTQYGVEFACMVDAMQWWEKKFNKPIGWHKRNRALLTRWLNNNTHGWQYND